MSSAADQRLVPVNIVMRTKNRALLLARALDDVLAQSFEDWRLTVVNDGGDPGAVEELLGARAELFRGRADVIHNERSRGMEAASNQGIRACESEFIAVHDDDDTWAPGFLETTVEWLRANPDASAVAVRTEIVWEAVEGARVTELSREVFLPERTDVTLFDLIRFNYCVPISMLYNARALEAVGLFDESLDVTGDWEANVRLAARGSIGLVGGPTLAFWHQRPELTGDLGNSVVALRDAHRRFDRVVRDRELRAYVQSHGVGLPMYLTRFSDDRFDEMRARLDDVIARLDRTERMLRRWPFEMAKEAVRRVLPQRRR